MERNNVVLKNLAPILVFLKLDNEEALINRIVEMNIEIYILEVPTGKDGNFTPLIYAIMMGGNKMCHKRNKVGRSGEIPYIERTWEMQPYQQASNGLANYNGQNRKQFLASDGRKTIIYPFSKWDKVVQANEFCKVDLNIADLTQVVHLKKAFSHFF
ncbi:MAG: hypothetical protein UR20_C0041G0006 [Candidatus Woesebacteria bacterium GW2011_GWE2_31_6]|nr:MAG: hypothetical protein UR20_C0041G0006 [Candidatus Woesebacteria bacterium GW2011_GWE2_31_6]